MNAPFIPETILALDQLKVGTKARVHSIDWGLLDEGEANRLLQISAIQREAPRRPRPVKRCTGMSASS